MNAIEVIFDGAWIRLFARPTVEAWVSRRLRDKSRSPVCRAARKSKAMAFVSEIIPPLVATYAAWLAWPINPTILAVFRMHPLLANRALNANRVVRYTLLRFTCSSRSHSCSVVSCRGLDGLLRPALLWTASSLANRSIDASTACWTETGSPTSQAIASPS